jgi:hypothetical protein
VEDPVLIENAPEYIDIPTGGGELLRVVYEMTVGDIIVAVMLLLVVVYLILSGVMKALWR